MGTDGFLGGGRMQQSGSRWHRAPGRVTPAWGILPVSAVLLLAMPALAVSAPESSLAAAIDFSGSHAVFSLAGTPVATDYSEIGLTVRQWFIPDVLSLGFRGGYLNVTQDANQDLHGSSLSGAYGGLDVDWHITWTSWFGFAAYGSETYHRATAQFSGQPLRIRWFGFHARMGPLVHIGLLSVGLGAFYRQAHGDRSISASSSVFSASQAGPFVSLALATGSHGRVKLVGEGGSWHTYLLSFRYGF